MKYVQNVLIIIFWLAVWHVAAVLLDNDILAVTPFDTMKVIADIFKSGELLLVTASSLVRILSGLLAAVLLGLAAGIISYRISFVERLLKPLVLAVKAVPVASVVVLLLIWQGSERLSVWISFLISFPIIYTNIIEGMKSTDKRLLEMADIFGISLWNRILYIYRPAVRGYVISGMRLAAGMSIKAGVAAEIIGLPDSSFGEKLYMAKIYLATDELFAWTVVIVAEAFICEKLIVAVSDLLLSARIPCIKNGGKDRVNKVKNNQDRKAEYAVRLNNISKSYGEKKIFENINLELKQGDKIGIMAPSGSGKTTLFRIIAGLEEADTGSVEAGGRISAVFQEPLLCEKADLLTNMRITGAADNETKYLASRLLKGEGLNKPVETYSLGMKRRCSIIRSLAKNADILIMDEPFASIDEGNRSIAAEVIRERTKDKTIIIFTHNEEEIRLIGGENISIFNKYEEKKL